MIMDMELHVALNEQIADLFSQNMGMYGSSFDTVMYQTTKYEGTVNETITIERVKITNNQGEKAIGKPIGNYITIDVSFVIIQKCNKKLINLILIIKNFINLY